MVLDIGYWMLDVGCWMLDVGCWMLDAVEFRKKIWPVGNAFELELDQFQLIHSSWEFWFLSVHHTWVYYFKLLSFHPSLELERLLTHSSFIFSFTSLTHFFFFIFLICLRTCVISFISYLLMPCQCLMCTNFI